MADTFSDLLGLRYQQTGANDNTWGELLNTDVFEVLENAITGYGAHVVTGGALNLAASPIVEQVLIFSGALTSNSSVTIPNLSKRMLVFNVTTGAFVLQMKTSGGAAWITIPQGTSKNIYCDGANGTYRDDRSEVGAITMFGTGTVPNGYLECDGGAISRTNFPELYATIGTTWGVGNGSTTFNLPDLKGNGGQFVRSRTAIVTVGTYQSADIAAHNHTASGTVSGTCGAITPSGSISQITPSGSVGTTINGQNTGVITSDSPTGPFATPSGGTAWGPVNGATLTATSTFTGNAVTPTFSGNSVTPSWSGTIAVTVANSSGTETRPINASVLMAIKY